MKKIVLSLLSVLVIAVMSVALYGKYLVDDHRADQHFVSSQAAAPDAAQIARGAYLAKAGNCMACHTVRGGPAYAGGRVIQSEFGDFIAPNITPDVATGIGSWNAEDFWQALHNGKSRDGSLLYPAFPYTNYTLITRSDADAMFAYLKTVKAVEHRNLPHSLRFPYNQRALLAFWRAAYFRPAVYRVNPQQSAQWNRGAYLINGLGHCSACHSGRNALGANGGSTDFSGGALPLTTWYAPSLVATAEASQAHAALPQIQSLLKHGITADAVVTGPMADVVSDSLQHLSDADIAAMSQYLRAIPTQQADAPDSLDQMLAEQAVGKQTMAMIMSQGAVLYKTHCADCHGAQGDGVAKVYPPLKANRAVLSASLANPLRLILSGGFPPATGGNPRPYSMPPFGPVLSDAEVAVVLTYVRNAWGNQAGVVTSADVNRYRTAPLD
ncbi:MAG: cytochrome c [Burkholderiales bacterium]|nr:cytochrome c [Burkholderiales bacterium]